MKSSIGRIVHFVTPEGKHLPAMIVSLAGIDLVNLQVFYEGEGEIHWRPVCRFDEAEHMAWTWHWPERVE